MSREMDISGRSITEEQAIELLWRYKMALEGLAPGGSEFVNDPEHCAKWLRESRASQHATIIRQQLKIKESPTQASPAWVDKNTIVTSIERITMPKTDLGTGSAIEMTGSNVDDTQGKD